MCGGRFLAEAAESPKEESLEDLYMVLSTDPWAALWSALHGACPSSRMGCSIVDWPNCYELGTLTFSELDVVARLGKIVSP